MRFRCLVLALSASVLIVLMSGCAHVEEAHGLAGKITPEALFAQVCAIGKDVHEVKGVVLMKAKSKEASGQLSGNVHAKAPSSVQFEILQPFGGVWATVKVEGNDYSINVAGKPDQSRRGRQVWAGIPLRFATELFLGRIPCATGTPAPQLAIDSKDELVVTGSNETFVYRFRDEGENGFWPESLSWRFLGLDATDTQSLKTVSVDFKFDEPEKGTRSPLRWEAHSIGGSSPGEIKLHWRNRDTS